jgi:hypothetical protein
LALASGQITAVDTLTIDLVEANEIPAVVIIRWPVKVSVLHRRRFPAAAEAAARTFSAAVVQLSQLKRGSTISYAEYHAEYMGQVGPPLARRWPRAYCHDIHP